MFMDYPIAKQYSHHRGEKKFLFALFVQARMNEAWCKMNTENVKKKFENIFKIICVRQSGINAQLTKIEKLWKFIKFRRKKQKKSINMQQYKWNYFPVVGRKPEKARMNNLFIDPHQRIDRKNVAT